MKQKTMVGVVVLFSYFFVSAILVSANSREIQQRQQFKEQLKATITQAVGKRLGELNKYAKITGTITAVNTNSITVLSDGKSYTINILSATQDSNGTALRRKFMGKATYAEFSVNNRVKVMGTWGNEERTTINASRIWNMSISKYRGAFVGNVISVDSSAIVFDPVKRERHTAYLSSTTKYANRVGATISLTDVKTGHKVRIRGTWDKSNKKLINVISVVDMSLPLLPTKTE